MVLLVSSNFPGRRRRVSASRVRRPTHSKFNQRDFVVLSALIVAALLRTGETVGPSRTAVVLVPQYVGFRGIVRGRSQEIEEEDLPAVVQAGVGQPGPSRPHQAAHHRHAEFFPGQAAQEATQPVGSGNEMCTDFAPRSERKSLPKKGSKSACFQDLKF